MIISSMFVFEKKMFVCKKSILGTKSDFQILGNHLSNLGQLEHRSGSNF